MTRFKDLAELESAESSSKHTLIERVAEVEKAELAAEQRAAVAEVCVIPAFNQNSIRRPNSIQLGGLIRAESLIRRPDSASELAVTQRAEVAEVCNRCNSQTA